MSELLQAGHIPSNTTGWNMVEDVRAPIFVQRPHSTNPRPPPLSLSIQLSSSSFSSSPSSLSAPPSPTSPSTLSPKSPKGSFFGALSRMVNYQKNSQTDSTNKSTVLAKEIPPSSSSPKLLSPSLSSSSSSSSLPPRKSTTPTTPTSPTVSPRSQLSDPEFIKQELQDKSMWEAEAMKEHPDILELIERIRPLNRAASFGRLLTGGQTAVLQPSDDILGRDVMLQLIMQHLNQEGLKVSRKVLEDESKIKYIDYQLSESRLDTLIQLAVKDTDKVWELAVAGEEEDSKKMLQQCLIDMGLLPEEDEVDVNIWDAEAGSNVVYVDEKDNIEALIIEENSGQESLKAIKAASLNQLIIALTPEKLPDLEYFKTFMLTYQSFTTPAKLLQKLIERYHVPRKDGTTEEEYKKESFSIQVRVGNVIKAWIRDHWTDFTPSLVLCLKNFVDNTLRLDANQTLVKSITTALNSKLRPEEGTEEEKEKLFRNPPPFPIVPTKTIFSPNLNVLTDVDEEEISRQLTLVDFELFSSIKASEFLNQAWNKPKLKHRSPNLLKAINHFNDISAWAANSILKIERVKERSKIMAKLIRIAEISMRTFYNFNAAMAILSGLNQAAVYRLKFTKEEMSKNVQQTYNELQTLLSSSSSYKEYRAILSRSVPPCIPYLGVFLTDLTFIEDGNPDYLYGGLINFSKRRLVYNVISQITSYQLSPYNLTPVYQISCHLHNPLQWIYLSEDEKYKLSLSREPRNKDRSEIL